VPSNRPDSRVSGAGPAVGPWRRLQASCATLNVNGSPPSPTLTPGYGCMAAAFMA